MATKIIGSAAIIIFLILIISMGSQVVSSTYTYYMAKGGTVDGFINGIDEIINPPIYQETIHSSLPDGSIATVTIYRNATDPTYEQLISFLTQDDTVYADYIPDQYVCINFAIHLADNAEKKGIKAHIVTVDFGYLSYDHAITAFNTTDKGWIYVDATGYSREDKATGARPRICIVNMIVGGQYIRNPIISQSGTEPSMGRIKSYEILN